METAAGNAGVAREGAVLYAKAHSGQCRLPGAKRILRKVVLARCALSTIGRHKLPLGPIDHACSKVKGREVCFARSTSGSYFLRFAASPILAPAPTELEVGCLSTLVKPSVSGVVTSRRSVRV